MGWKRRMGFGGLIWRVGLGSLIVGFFFFCCFLGFGLGVDMELTRCHVNYSVNKVDGI